MRVLVVVPWEPWRVSDGIVLPMHHHLHALAGRHALTVVAGGSRSGAEQRRTGVDAALPDGVVVRWTGTGVPPGPDYVLRRLRSELSGEPAHVHWVERPALLRAVDEEARRADVVHLVGWGTAQLAARVAPVPAVHYAVDPWEPSWENRRLSRARRLADAGQRAKVGRHEARHYPQAACVVVVAESDAAHLRATVPGVHVDVVPNGVDPGPAPTPLPSAPVLGFHGAFETQANVDGATALVEQVLPRVRVTVPDARVLLVGRTPPRAVQALAERPGVELRADVPDVRAELDRVRVHVSWMPSGRGQKNKVLEALAAGRPAVVNALGASGIGPGGGLEVAPDLDAAAAAVVRLLQDDPHARAASVAARERVLQEFTWEASARGIERAWERARR
ncbi:MAG: glycosyl transferase group 1 [Frankiales bacterium]|nr:glycosyl transferase group 1 [Frankiales bacterium]